MMDTEEQKPRVANRRPMIAVAAACFVGALFAYFAVRFGAQILCAVLLGLGAIVAAVLLRKRRFAVLLCALMVFVFATTLTTFMVRCPLPFQKNSAQISGRIVAVNTSGDGFCKISLNQVVIEGVPVSGKMHATIQSLPPARVGDRVEFQAKCEAIDPFSSSYHLGLLAENTTYLAEASGFRTHQRGDLNFLEKIEARISSAVLSVMSVPDAGITLSLLFGDKSNLSPQDYSAVKASGTAHVFAVSGLNVSFLVAVVVVLLKKLKCKSALILGIVAAILVGYGFLCGFSASFLRAAFMSLVLLLAGLVLRRYDALSALAFSGAVIMLCDPLSMFTVGFQMSFAALIGMILLYKPLKRGIGKVVRWNGLSASLAMSLSSTLGIFPVTTAYFGTFSTYFLLSNLIIVPLVTITYFTLIVALPLAFISAKAFGFLFYPGMYLVRALVATASFFAALPLSLVPVVTYPLSTAGYYGAFFVFSPFCLLEKKKKLLFGGIFAIFAVLSFIIFSVVTLA